jgi:ABC-type uncharacterized transport system YnjBCD ATPase subunit
MRRCEGEFDPGLGQVSVDIPLISNLDVWENIALIQQYHYNAPMTKAKRLVLEALDRYGLQGIAHLRNPSLSAEERFRVMLLRASSFENATILIDRPFLLMPHLKDAGLIYDYLDTIADLYSRCHIFDYIWHRDRY